MLSRIMWVSVAGLALIAGMALQNDWAFSWDDDAEVSERAVRSVEERVDRAIDRSFDNMQVHGSDGKEIDVPAETKRAMADAVSRLVKAETDIALAKVGDDDEKAIAEASIRRDKARADVERVKVEIKSFERAAQSEHDAVQEQIEREIREDVRASVREAVRS